MAPELSSSSVFSVPSVVWHWPWMEATAPAEEVLLTRQRVGAHPRGDFRVIRSEGDELPQRIRFGTGRFIRGDALTSFHEGRSFHPSRAA